MAVVLIVFMVLIGGIFYSGKFVLSLLVKPEEVIIADIYDPSIPGKLNIELTTDNYLIERVNDGEDKIVFANNENEKIYPASLTKLMVLYVATAYIADLDEMMVVNYHDQEGLLENNASVIGLQVNDEISLRNALYGLILNSGGDCANVIKRYFAEHDIDLLIMMNQEAQELGMKNTHFSNVTGLHDSNNYTTLFDLSLLGTALLQNAAATEIIETYYREDDGYIFRSTARNYEDLFMGGPAKIVGGKTGYVIESNLNYFAIVENSAGQTSLVILAGSDIESEYGKNAHFEDALKILKYCFE